MSLSENERQLIVSRELEKAERTFSGQTDNVATFFRPSLTLGAHRDIALGTGGGGQILL